MSSFNRWLEGGLRRRIHVSSSTIKKNKTCGKNDPAIMVLDDHTTHYCYDVYIDGPSQVVQQGEGRVGVWMETSSTLFLKTAYSVTAGDNDES